VAFTRDCACDVVANSKRAKAFAPALAQRAERVCSFAALADCEYQCLRRHRRVAMAEFTGVIHLRWDARHSLDYIFANSRRVQGGAASRENYSPDIAQLRRRHVESTQLCGAFVRVQTAAHCVADRVWLLKDFFEHVMGIITLADIFSRKLNLADRMLSDIACKRTDFELIRSSRDDIEVVQINSIARVSDDRAYIAGQKHFAVADSEY